MVSPTSGAGGAGNQGGGAGGRGSGGGGAGGFGGAMDASTGPNDASAGMDAGLDAGDGGLAPIGGKAYVYVGTGSWGDANAGRIAVYALADDGTFSFVERVEAGGIAAFMTLDLPRRLLYVADEGDGALLRYIVDPSTGKLTLDDHIDLTSNPVYVSLDSSGNTLLSASYEQGLAQLFAVGDDGFVEPASDTESTGTQAHSILASANDAFAYVCNKGADSISQFAFDAASHALTPLAPAAVASPGPRHSAFSADGRLLYVVSELQDSVRSYARAADGTLSLSQDVPRLPAGSGGTGAHVLLSPRGHLYVSNRGPSNTIAVYAIDTVNGNLSLVEHEPTMGQTPRNFTVDPAGRFLLVGNQDSRNVAVFAIDAATGELEHRHTVAVEGSVFFVGVYAF